MHEYIYSCIYSEPHENQFKCFHTCIENQYMERHKCLPNPFVSKTFRLLNSSQTEKRICDKNRSISEIESNYCQNFCLKDCNQIYFSTRFDNSLVLNISETNITINYENSVEFQYTSEPKYRFVDYLSNIGGLCGLWFGFAFIDFSELLKIIMFKLKILINYYVNLSFFLDLAQRSYVIHYLIAKLKNVILILDKIKWKLLIRFLTFPFILYQIWELTDSYLNYKTEVSVEWIPYRDSENRLKNESIPSITICFEHIFQRILFDPKLRASLEIQLQGIEQDNVLHYWITRFKLFKEEMDPVLNNEDNSSKYIMEDIEVDTNITSNSTYIRKINRFYFTNFYSYPLVYTKPNFRFNEKIMRMLSKYLKYKKLLLKYINVKDFEEYEEIQKQINDKTSNDFNETQNEFYFYSHSLNCLSNVINNGFSRIKFQRFCDYIEPIVQILSPFGKCRTFRSKINSNEFNNNSETISIDKNTVLSLTDGWNSYLGSLYAMRFIKMKFFIHSIEVFPDFTTEEIHFTDNSLNQMTDFTIFLNKYEFKKLPKPYETQCQEYGDSYVDSNRFKCLNNCYRNGYNRHLNCTPNHNHLLTIQLNDGIIEPKVKFCVKNEDKVNEINWKLNRLCFKSCPESCKQILFRPSIEMSYVDNGFRSQPKHVTYDFKIKDKTFIKINFEPKYLFINLIIDISNTLSLWHGISFQDFLFFISFLSIIVNRVKNYFSLQSITMHIFLKKYFQVSKTYLKSYTRVIYFIFNLINKCI